MGILCSVCVWHSVVPLLAYDHYLALTADRCALVIMGSIYFMFHMCFFLYIYFVVRIILFILNTLKFGGARYVFFSKTKGVMQLKFLSRL